MATSKNKKIFMKANVHEITYSICSHKVHDRELLIDRRANGGIAGPDLRMIAKLDRRVDVCGIDNHQMTNLPIITAGGMARSQRGEVVIILHQYAHVPQGKTIHSCIQLESFSNRVDNKSIRLLKGTQSI